MKLITREDYEQYLNKKPCGEFYAVVHGMTFESVYQPIFGRDETILGFEALLRITRNDGTTQRPDLLFGDPAINPNRLLAYELLTRVIHIRNFARHFSEHKYKLFINVHPNSFLSTIMGADYKSTGLLDERLKQVNLTSDRLVFEVIEHPCLEDVELQHAVNTLKNHGYSIAIDDFGAKCSNRKRVKELTPNFIKIDRSYLLRHCAGETHLIPDAIMLANEMGANVVIEGVEEPEQYHDMKNIGIDFFQGYLLGKPSPISHWVSELMETA